LIDCYPRRNLDEAKEVFEIVDRVHELNLQFGGVRAASQIATALAVRELVFGAMFNEVVHLSVIEGCIYKSRTKKTRGFARMGRFALIAATTAAYGLEDVTLKRSISNFLTVMSFPTDGGVT
jgi:hypothetical protein